MQSVSVMIKPASGECDMNCSYCFYRDEQCHRAVPSFGKMSDETLKNVIRRTLPRAERVISYAFQGGEPTLAGLDYFRRAVEYQKSYNRHGVRVINALQTNGQSLSEPFCRFLHDEGFLVGVSIDGTRDIHDCFRHRPDGASSFDHALKSIKLLERFSVPYNILTVVTDKLCESTDEVYSFYRLQGFDNLQFVACLSPIDTGEELLSPSTYGNFLIKLFRLWRDDILSGRAPKIRMFDNYLDILSGCRPESCEQSGICGEHMVVESDGSVYPCDFYALDENLLGNLNTDNMDKISSARKEIGFIEASAPNTVCRECKYYKLCRGGCRRNRDFTGINRFCESYRMFFDACMDELTELYNTLVGKGK